MGVKSEHGVSGLWAAKQVQDTKNEVARVAPLNYGIYNQLLAMSQRIERLTFDGNNMLIRSNGRKYRVRTELISARLARADQAAKENFRLSPEGFTISWPRLQLEMSVAGVFQMCQTTY
jgi:hypothetical protein